MSKTFNITIRAWDTEYEPKDVLAHVTKQAEQGFTSGHDMGLYWEIKEPNKKEEAIRDAAPDLLAMLIEIMKLNPDKITIRGTAIPLFQSIPELIKKAEGV